MTLMASDPTGGQYRIQRRSYWKKTHDAISNVRQVDDRLVVQFEYLTGTRNRDIADRAWEEAATLAAALKAAGATGRFGVFLDLYMRRPAVYLRDRDPGMPIPLAVTSALRQSIRAA